MIRRIKESTRLAIVAKGQSWRSGVAWMSDNWKDDRDIWSVNQQWLIGDMIPLAPVVFELHPYDDMDQDYWQREQPLHACPLRQVVHSERIEWPNAVEYPWERVANAYGTAYSNHTMPMMMQLAILFGYTEILLCGCDYYDGEEATYQLPCLMYWIGRAHEHGVKILTTDRSKVGIAGPVGDAHYMRYNKFAKETRMVRV